MNYTMSCYLKGCIRCGGDVVSDEGDWKCWQCGQYFYPPPEGDLRLEPMDETHPMPPEGDEGSGLDPFDISSGDVPKRGRRKKYGPRAARNIDAVVRAKEARDERWWARNTHIVEHLDRGLSVREIAVLVERGQRQIRNIRERLADLRAEQEGPEDKP